MNVLFEYIYIVFSYLLSLSLSLSLSPSLSLSLSLSLLLVPPTLIGNLVERCMKKMSISEVVTVFGGVTGPLVTIHPTLREFIKERLLNGEEPTNDNIPQAIESFVSELPAVLNQLQVIERD